MKAILASFRILTLLAILAATSVALPAAHAGLYGAYFGGIPDSSAAPDGGVPLREVKPDSPAAEAGLQPGDVIMKFGGVSIRSVDELRLTVQSQRPEEPVPVIYIRQGKERQTEVTLKAKW